MFLEEDHRRTSLSRFGVIWLDGFGGEMIFGQIQPNFAYCQKS